MGLTLEFYQGDPDALALAFENAEFEVLDDPGVVARTADLSLHITPRDLNLLSLQVGRITGADPMELRPHLDIVVDEEDRGLLAVSASWVAYLAALKPSHVASLVSAWFEAMQREHGDSGIRVTPEATRGVRDLVDLCVAARLAGSSVMHAWML